MYGYPNYSYNQNYGMNPNYMQRSFGSPTPSMPQPQNMPQNSPPSAFNYDTPIQDIKFVNKAQAEAFLVFPNTTVLLIDKEEGIAHLKSADSTGLSKTKLYKIQEINPDGSPIKIQTAEPNINYEDFSKKFVTIEQYEKLLNKIKALQEIIVVNKNAQSKEANRT